MATARATRRVAVASACSLLMLAVGCGRYEAEQDGQDVGEALCDVRATGSDGETHQALAEVESQLDELASDSALLTEEDRSDVRENLEDLAEHLAQGDEVLIQQDLAAIRANLRAIAQDVGETGQAAVDGFLQAMDDCAGD